MKNRTFTFTVPAERASVFGYFANPENLPQWATEFCLAIRKDGDRWRIDTPDGEMYFAVTADEKSGVVDMHAGPKPDQMAPLHVRVFGTPGSTTATFTFHQGPECSDEQYEQQCRSFKKELRAVAERFKGGDVTVAGARPEAYTGLVVGDPITSGEFYEKHLGFVSLFSSKEYVHLLQPSNGVEVALLKAGECTQMKEFETATTGGGLWLGLEVPNADDECARLWDAGLEIVQPPTDQPWGERTCVIRDPDGVLIYLAHKIPMVQALKEELQTA